MTARVVSLNVGMPRPLDWRETQIVTGIFKLPVDHRLRVGALNLDGDGQADLTVHGGVDKAVYAYPVEHYPWWRAALSRAELGYGHFGENFTTSGLLEGDVHIGDRFRIGSAEFVVTQPRMPCFKLGLRFGLPDMPKRFLASRRTGFYLRVLREGDVGAGDAVELLGTEPHRVAVADITELYLARDVNADLLRRALQVDDLAAGWRDEFAARLA